MDDPDETAITPEQAELLLRLMQDPEARQRLAADLQRSVLNPKVWAQIGEQLKSTYLNPEFWRRVADTLAKAFMDPEIWRRAAAQIGEAYSPERIRATLEAIHEESAEMERRWPGVVEAGKELQEQVSDAEEVGPPISDGKPLSWWLVTRAGRQQVGLLVAALAVLSAAESALANAAGTEVPQGLKDATKLAFAMAAFLLLWLGHRYPDE